MERSSIKLELWRFALAVLWLGMIAAISFLEAPLKFLAPGITIPLGLGIGRLVFFALNVVEGLLLISLLALTWRPSAFRANNGRWGSIVALAAVFLVKVLVIRPPLNARTDLVLAGAEAGESAWHYFYIACDLATIALLVVVIVQAGRAILSAPSLGQPAAGFASVG